MRGEYNTRQKRDLLRFLKAGDVRHFSVDDVVFELQEQGEKVGRTTVYRYLEQLAETGCVRKYQNAQGATQYQYIENSERCSKHFHMLCSRCGDLMHVECERMDELSRHLMEEHGFYLDTVQTVLVGTCAKCREAKD